MKVKDESSKFWFSRIYCTEKSTELYIQVVQRRESGETMVEKLALESFLEVTDCEFGYFFGNKFDGKGWLFSAMRRLQLLGWNVEEEDLKTLTAFRGNHDFRVHFTESYSEIFRVWRISRGEPALGETSV
jgi:hypothetical protein